MGQKILIIRSKEQSLKLAKFLENQGFECFLEPIFDVEKLQVKIDNKNVEAIILTSFNAVSGFFLAKIDQNVKIFTLSKKIKEELQKNGYKNIFLSKCENAKSLEKIINLQKENFDKNSRILYFCGNFMTKNFAKILEKQGFLAENILSYKISYHQEFSQDFLTFIKKNKFDFVLCYSKNAVKNFNKLIKFHNLVEYFKNCKIIGFSDKIVAEIKKNNFKKFGNFKEIDFLKKFHNL